MTPPFHNARGTIYVSRETYIDLCVETGMTRAEAEAHYLALPLEADEDGAPWRTQRNEGEDA